MNPADRRPALYNQKSKIKNQKSPRGVALLLVMIGLVICSILTAGFLATQGTSIGIARNERDAEKAHDIALSGIDMCYWLMNNRPDWRTSLTPGTWLNTVPVGDGSVTVTAASADGTNSFANSPTQPAVFTSVATVSGRTFTLTATIGPTGGGTVFRGGNYATGQIIMGNNNLAGAALVDSYNSSVAPYNSLLPGTNALFGSSYHAGGSSLLIYFLSAYHGSFVGSSQQNLSTSVYGTLGAVFPTATSLATIDYVPGSVILPNMTGLSTYGSYSMTSNNNLSNPGNYTSFTVSPTGLYPTNVNITASGIYHVAGNLTINNLASVTISNGVDAVFVVDGNITLTGPIKLSGSATLALYAGGNVTLLSNAAINGVGGNTANFTLLGNTTGTVTLNSSSQIVGALYLPQAAVLLQNTSPKIYGAVISKTLTLSDNSALHFDENLKNKRLDNITGGSAPAGTADYNVSIVGSTSFSHH